MMIWRHPMLLGSAPDSRYDCILYQVGEQSPPLMKPVAKPVAKHILQVCNRAGHEAAASPAILRRRSGIMSCGKALVTFCFVLPAKICFVKWI